MTLRNGKIHKIEERKMRKIDTIGNTGRAQASLAARRCDGSPSKKSRSVSTERQAAPPAS